MTEKARALTELLDLIVEEPLNALRIRGLCREHPGLIASAGLRLKIWSILVLGIDHKEDYNHDIVGPKDPCSEQHVLEADVPRTRAEVAEFRSPAWRDSIRLILQKLCVDHDIQYKQGMNEVLAPFMSLNPPPGGQLLTYALFRAFLFRYLERFFCVDDSAYLFKAFRLFHVLLVYFDPQLAHHLSDFDCVPELYAPQWFLTLFARSLPLPHVLRLWDMLIAVDDPAFMFFVGVCLLRGRREELLRCAGESLPEVLSQIAFKTEEDVDEVMRQSRELYQESPKCFTRLCRLCCAGTIELTPAPPKAGGKGLVPHPHTSVAQLDIQELDEALNSQATRHCVTLTPQELVSQLARIVVIDLRPPDEVEISGAGTLPRALQLSPDFLNRPEAFSVWVQHFDSTRGCEICIVDLPPPSWKGGALWRRLLWGEGDGGIGGGGYQSRYDFEDIQENKRRLEALIGVSKVGGDGAGHKKTGAKVSKATTPRHGDTGSLDSWSDLQSPSMLLAVALQRNCFPKVSVLGGGFPSLVAYLAETRGGRLEPLVLNHQGEVWEQFLRKTGREVGSRQKARVRVLGGDEESEGQGERKLEDLTERERLEMGLRVAERLQHTTMAAVIKEKLVAQESAAEGQST